MHKYVNSLILMRFATATTACATSGSIISDEQRILQNQVDEIVSAAFFDRELDTHAPYNIRNYNIHNDGMVVIKFDDSIL